MPYGPNTTYDYYPPSYPYYPTYPTQPWQWYEYDWSKWVDTKTTSDIEIEGDTMNAVDDMDVWIAMKMPWEDDSGEAVVLGVFDTEQGAKARCWDCMQRLGGGAITQVIYRPMNALNEGDPDNQIEDPAVEQEWFDEWA